MNESYSIPWDTLYPNMDQEKPQTVVSQIVDFSAHEETRLPVTPNIEYAGPPSINEADNVEDRKDHRGENVW
jgi:hypothetical protein